MGVPQRQLIEAMRNKVNDVDERYKGYREELAALIDEILTLERQRPHNVAQQVQRLISTRGEVLAKKQREV